MSHASLTDRIVSLFQRPRRRSMSRNRTVCAGLESLEPKRVLSGTGWEPGLNFEQESNDSRGLADPLATTTSVQPDADTVITGGIRSVGDIDYYKFTLHSRADVQLDLYKLHPDLYQFRGDLDLRLESSNGTSIEDSNRGGGSPERITRTLDAGTYFAKVWAYDALGFGESYQLRLQSEGQGESTVVPGTPILAGSSTTSDTTPTFRWTSATNATRYELWVNSNRINQVIHDTNVTGTSYTPSSALASGTHNVWVRAWNGSTPGAWSRAYSFELIGDDPVKPRVTVPATTTDTTPTISWTSGNATHYEVWVNNTTTGQRVLYRDHVTGTSIVPDTEFSQGQHVVWVRAWNGSQRSYWSDPQRFEVVGVGTPTVTGPGSTTDSTPTFTWTASVGATRYELWVQNRTTGQRVIYRNDVQGTSFTDTEDLSSGNYSTWVRAWNGSQKSVWSARRDFTLAASVNPDPNGSNNVRTNSIYLANRSTTDHLTSADQTDYYHVAASSREARIRFTWTIEVTSGNSSDISALVEDERGAEWNITLTRTGNTITLSTGSAYLYTRYRGYQVYLKLQLRPGAAPVEYRITSSNVDRLTT